MKRKKRIGLEPNTIIPLQLLHQEALRIDRLLSEEGTTCLVYEGCLLHQGMEERKVIVKEFYPKSSSKEAFFIEREPDGKLHVNCVTKDQEHYQERLKQFFGSYEKQKAMSNESALMEIMVKPLGMIEYGDSFYLLSDMHQGKSLSMEMFSTLKEKVNILQHIVDMLQILEREEYLFLDLKLENILYTHPTKKIEQIRLFDMDSMIKRKELGQIDTLYYNNRYLSPNMRRLFEGNVDFESKKRLYIRPEEVIYSFGMLSFEMFFDRLPTESELQWSDKTLSLLSASCKQKYGISGKAARMIVLWLKGMLEESFGKRIHCAVDVWDALEEIIEQLQFAAFTPRNEVVKANYLYTCYHMLEIYPVFQFAQKNEHGGYTMDVSLIGSHKMRTELLQALISCVQMLDSKLIIRLFASDAVEFWKDFVSEKKNPQLLEAVLVWHQDRKISSGINTKLVKQPLAHIYLYEDSSLETVLPVLAGNEANYVVLMEEDFSFNYQKGDKILTGAKRENPLFIGFLAEEDDVIEVPQYKKKKIQTFAIHNYDEKIYKSRISRMGLAVEAFYYKGTHPCASMKEVKQHYYSGLYYQESSQRCALHMIYKLASVGITDLNSRRLLQQLYDYIFDETNICARRNYERLTSLEQTSWIAYMLSHGASLWSAKDVELYAFQNGNDWKDQSDPCHKKHPFLVAWEELDETSQKVHQAIRRIAEERKEFIQFRLMELKTLLSRSVKVDASALMTKVEQGVEACYQLEKDADQKWEALTRKVNEQIENAENYKAQLKKCMQELDELMQPILECMKKINIKKHNESLVQAIPRILLAGIEEQWNHYMLIKPVSSSVLDNVYSCLLLEPEKLILLTDSPETFDLTFYQTFLKERGLDVKVSLELPKRYYGKIYADFTGADPIWVHRLDEMTKNKEVIRFSVKNGKIQEWDDPSVRLFQKEISLTNFNM